MFDLSSAVTDEYGVARVQVSSVTAATDTVAVVADGILIGEPTVQFTALPDTELSLEVTISTISTSAVIGDTVSFSIGVRNPADSTDTASSIELSGNLFETLQLDPLAPGEATVTGVQYIVTEEDLPELLLSVKVTASGAANPSVLVTGNQQFTLPVSPAGIDPNPSGSTANLAFVPLQRAPVAIAGRNSVVALGVTNSGTADAANVRLRLSLPAGIEVDASSLSEGTYDPVSNQITWQLDMLEAGQTRAVSYRYLAPADLNPGDELAFRALVLTDSIETSFDDNTLNFSSSVELAAPSRVVISALDRTWLIADGSDSLTLLLTVFDQLDEIVPDTVVTVSAGSADVQFDPAILTTDSMGQARTDVRSTSTMAVVVTASIDGQPYTTYALNQRSGAVQFMTAPQSIGVGGQDRYQISVTNIRSLADGEQGAGDVVDLTLQLPPQLAPEWFAFQNQSLPLAYGDADDTWLTVTIPPISQIASCAAIVGTHPFSVVATGQTSGFIGQADGQLTIVAAPPEATDLMPANAERIGSQTVLFSWRSNTPGESIVHWRRQGEAEYRVLSLTGDAVDGRRYRGVLDLGEDTTGTVYEWYGTIDNGCSQRSIGDAVRPRTFTRVRSTTFVMPDYDFRVADGYDIVETVNGRPLTVQVRNDSDEPRAMRVNVDNPYEDLILGFIGSGSVDQMLVLQPGEIFDAQLRVFTQQTQREAYSLALNLVNDQGDVDRIPLVVRVRQPRVDLSVEVLNVDPMTQEIEVLITNNGDDLTDLQLGIANADTGAPIDNIFLNPGIDHTLLRSGEQVKTRIISVRITSEDTPATQPIMFFGRIRGFQIPGMRVQLEPDRVRCAGEFLTCRVPAGYEIYSSNDYYCSNYPAIDVPISVGLAHVANRGVPITGVAVSASFTPGPSSETVYNHTTYLGLNATMVDSGTVPEMSTLSGPVPVSALRRNGDGTQIINIRSQHTNPAHYTVTSDFKVVVAHAEYTRSLCVPVSTAQRFEDEIPLCSRVFAIPGGGSSDDGSLFSPTNVAELVNNAIKTSEDISQIASDVSSSIGDALREYGEYLDSDGGLLKNLADFISPPNIGDFKDGALGATMLLRRERAAARVALDIEELALDYNPYYFYERRTQVDPEFENMSLEEFVAAYRDLLRERRAAMEIYYQKKIDEVADRAQKLIKEALRPFTENSVFVGAVAGLTVAGSIIITTGGAGIGPALIIGLKTFDTVESTLSLVQDCYIEPNDVACGIQLITIVPDLLDPTFATELLVSKPAREAAEVTIREAFEEFGDDVVSTFDDDIIDALDDDIIDALDDDIIDALDDDVADAVDDDIADSVDELLENCLRNSFAPYTLVTTTDGFVPIIDIAAGDHVYAYHESAGSVGVFDVVAQWSPLDEQVTFVTIDGELIETTPWHDFYTDEGWQDAGELANGDLVLSLDGDYGIVDSIRTIDAVQRMYDLTIADAHTFAVGTGQWVVHNDCIVYSDYSTYANRTIVKNNIERNITSLHGGLITEHDVELLTATRYFQNRVRKGGSILAPKTTVIIVEDIDYNLHLFINDSGLGGDFNAKKLAALGGPDTHIIPDVGDITVYDPQYIDIPVNWKNRHAEAFAIGEVGSENIRTMYISKPPCDDFCRPILNSPLYDDIRVIYYDTTR